MKDSSKLRVLAIASAGGHWVQLMRLIPAWKGCHIIYVSTSVSRLEEITQKSKEEGISPPDFFVIVEATRWEKFKLLKQLMQIVKVLFKERPHVIISTGAAPGFFALRIGKLLGARTIWVDSIANAERLSLSGEKARNYADLWLTQWEHLAKQNNEKKKLRYEGSVI